MQRLSVVFVGCGGISRSWFGTAAMRDLVEVVGLVDLDPDRACALRAQAGLPESVPVSDDLASLLQRLRPEAVFDCTVPEAHHSVTTTALAAGCHVLGEKPLASDIVQAREMVATAAAADRHYAVTQTRRWNPDLHRLRHFLASGSIGRPHSYFAQFFIAADFGGFRAAMPHVLLLDMAIHHFDSARFLIGAPEPVWVQASEWNPPGSRYAHGASAVATVGFSDGSILAWQGSWTAAGRQSSWECDWTIQGDSGAVSWTVADGLIAEVLADPDQPSAAAGGGLIRELDQVPVPDLDPPLPGQGHDGAIRDFVTSIRANREPACPAHDNIHSLAMVLAAIESAEQGQRISIRS